MNNANTGRKGEHLHDSMAKAYFGNPQNMANFLEQCLPAHMVEALDLESLESSAETFVDDAFKQYIADLVFTCKTRNGRHGSVYILFEHKSQPEPVCALQILKYMVGIWIRFFENGLFGITKCLPFVIPVVFYHGKQKWNGKQMRDLFGDDTTFSSCIPDFSMIVYSLKDVSRETLEWDLFGDDTTFSSCIPDFSMIVYSLKDVSRETLESKLAENTMFIFLQALLLKDPADKISEAFLLYTGITSWKPHEKQTISDAIDIFFRYADTVFPRIAKQAKQHIEEQVMNASITDADRMEVIKSWFPWMIDTVSRVTYAEAKTKVAAKAKAEGWVEAQRTTIIQLLHARFGDVPQSIEANLEKIDDSAKLSRLTIVAGTAPSLDDVTSAIRMA